MSKKPIPIWMTYGKGTIARKGALASNGQRQCNDCDKILTFDYFSGPRITCKMCVVAQAAKRNDKTRSGAENDCQPWTDAEDHFIRDNAATMTDRQMAARVGRTMRAVGQRRYMLGITKAVKAVIPITEFGVHRCNSIKQITVCVNRPKVTVYCPAKTRTVLIYQVFIKEGLTAEDYNNWKAACV